VLSQILHQGNTPDTDKETTKNNGGQRITLIKSGGWFDFSSIIKHLHIPRFVFYLRDNYEE